MWTKTIFQMALLGSAGLANGALYAAAATAPAAGTENVGLEEVIVTAQRREESLQNTPISVVQFGARALENLGFNNLADVQSNVPNLVIRQSNVSAAGLRFYIRGIGTNDVQVSQDPSVGLYVDGFYVARSSGAAFQVADVERIEVLRGPQGSLYGRNTTGGAINIINKKPSGDFDIKETLSAGNFSLFETLTQINLPRWHDLAAKITYLNFSQDGFVKNLGQGRNFGDRDSQAVRVALNWSPADNFSADYVFDSTHDGYEAPYYQTINKPRPAYSVVPYSADRIESVNPRNYVPGSRLKIDGHSLTLQYHPTEAVTIRSLTGYRGMNDLTYQNYADNAVTPTLFSNGPEMTRDRQFSQELQVLGSGFDNTLDYIGGLYYFDEHSQEDQQQFISLLIPTLTERLLLNTKGTTHNSAEAAYGQVDWKLPVLDHRLKLSVGGRYSRDKRSLDLVKLGGLAPPFSADAHRDWSNFSPSTTLAFQVNDQVNTYVKYVEGYKTGGFNGRAASVKAAETPVNEEKVNTVEAGIKSEFWQNKLRVNAAAFWSDYDNIQLFFVDSPGVTIAFNAGKARIDGLELDLEAAPIKGLQMTVNYGYLDPHIERVTDPKTGLNTASMFTLPSAPKHTVNANIDYTFPQLSFGVVSADVNYAWRDRARFAVNNLGTPGEESLAYGLLDARMTLDEVSAGAGGELKFALWGKNLTDKQYLTDLIPSFTWSSLVGTFGQPRSYGIDVTYLFH